MINICHSFHLKMVIVLSGKHTAKTLGLVSIV